MPSALTSPVSIRRAVLAAALLGLAVAAASAPAALASPAFYAGNSADGTIAVFTTKEQMVPGDTDQEEDIFVRSLDTGLGEYLTRQVSIGPNGGNDAQPAHYDGISRDGTEIFFSTSERLTPDDTDSLSDLYVRDLTEKRTLLVSVKDPTCTALSCPGVETAASFLADGVAPDGGVVFFGTVQRLAPTDQDGTFDFYARDVEAETTELVSAPDPGCSACTAEARALQFSGTDASGRHAFFTTEETLTSDDDDGGEEDIYVRDRVAGNTDLVSIRGTCPPDLPSDQNCEPSFGGASPDGSHVFFETNERVLEAEDTDKFQDLYDWTGGGVTLISTGLTGGNGEGNVTFAGSTAGGEVAYFETTESLVPGDADSVQDVYRHEGVATTLVSGGEGGRGNLAVPASFEEVSRTSPDVAIFTTAEALVAADVDLSQDVYARSGGTLALLSVGPEGGDAEVGASFAGASDDGSKVFFSTAESLVAGDTDSSADVYMRSGESTVLVSGGQGVGGNGEFFAGLRGVSAAGSRAFFTTQERLTVDDDFATEQDLYGWTPSGTLLVSVKNSPDLVIGPPPPTLEATSPASPNPSTTPTIVGQAVAGSLIKVYKTSNCSGEPVAQGTASQLASPGLTVTVPVASGTTTNYKATAEADGVVSVCSSQISYKQEDPPPPVEEGASGGSIGGGGATTGPTGTSGSGKTGKTAGGGKGGIEYVVPQLKITFGPAFKTRLRRPVFRFADLTGQPGTKFFCRVDKQPWKGCTSPVKVKTLKFGRHVFALKAVNAVGTPGARPLKRALKVVAG
ncbi:MAG TPA: hypothetical protein VHP56_05540 [Solirubrobacterales bacterium]|jgi:hypothetical protein|nr:hypothetical protein [Solirubrobacterales bacterium]